MIGSAAGYYYSRRPWGRIRTVILGSIIATSNPLKYVEDLKKYLNGSIFVKGSLEYEKRRLVHNALCDTIYPDLIALPKSTLDVSTILKITNQHDVPISVRSGGHSYTCTSIKQGKINYKFICKSALFHF